MAWASIYYFVDGGSLTAKKYRDDVFDPKARTFVGAIGDDFVLMHDNARSHVARMVQGYMQEARIEVMDCQRFSSH